MAARIITVANQKGGSGKTTLSMVLAGALALRGNKVLVVDADPQGTATQWAGAASEDKPFPATVIGLANAKGKLHQMVKPLVDDYAFVIIDCPPSVDEQASQSALLVSDACVIPLQPTPADMWATVGIVELVGKARLVNPDLRAFGVPNRVTASSLGKQVLDVMRENEIEFLDAKLGNRTSFQEATIRGSVPSQMGFAHKAAAAEVEALTTELLKRLELK
jgi:chromosome partitioning protein